MPSTVPTPLILPTFVKPLFWQSSAPPSCGVVSLTKSVIYPAPLVIALLFRDISAEPSKATPAIFLAVVSVAADPVVFWFNVGTKEAEIVPVSRLDASLAPSSFVFKASVKLF